MTFFFNTGELSAMKARASKTSDRGMRGRFLAVVLMAAAVAGCRNETPTPFQGYVEGDYVQVAAPVGGRLVSLAVSKGAEIRQGEPLFRLEEEPEAAEAASAGEALRQARARLADLRKGSRPTEVAALKAKLAEAEAALRLAKAEHRRRASLFERQAVSREELDRAATQYTQAQAQVAALSAEIETANLGGRSDAVAAAEADVAGAEARLSKARWSLEQKNRSAPRTGRVFDTFYEPGEWVPAGRPVVSLLPPENVKIRFFVPEPVVASFTVGRRVRVGFDGGGPVTAEIRYVSPEAEYTPPVIYSTQNRASLVFLLEASVPAQDAVRLHPGQPVDVFPEPAS